MKSVRLWTIAFLSAVVLVFGSLAFAEEAEDPGSPGKDLGEKMQAFQAEQQAVRGELKALKASFADLTEEEKKAAMEQWRTENVERIQTMKQLRSELIDEFNEAVKDRIRTRTEARETMRQRLGDMTAEERQAAIADLKQRLRDQRRANDEPEP